MKKLLLVLAFTAMSAYCAFADVVISGHVRSYLSRNAIIDAEVRVPGTNVSVIANEDGFFSLKLDYHASEIPNLRKEAFNRYDFLDNQTADFNDSAFWADYNILEPSESLEHAIGRLKKIAR